MNDFPGIFLCDVVLILTGYALVWTISLGRIKPSDYPDFVMRLVGLVFWVVIVVLVLVLRR